MKILGIDPGVASTGWGVVETDDHAENGLKLVDFGVIKTSKDTELAERLLEIHVELIDLVKKFKPDHAAVEQLFFYNNAKTAIAVGEARGIVLLSLCETKVPFKEFTPLQVKDAVCGYGKADKKQVQSMVKMLLGMDHTPKPDDAADGLAIAICCSTSLGMEKRLTLSDN